MAGYKSVFSDPKRCAHIYVTLNSKGTLVRLTPYVESLTVLLVPDQVGDAERGSQLQLHIRMPLTERQDESEIERDQHSDGERATERENDKLHWLKETGCCLFLNSDACGEVG